MSTTESKLVVSLLDKLTAPARGITATINRLTAASRANAARMAEVRSRMMDAVGAGYALYRGLSAPLNAAMDFESAMADVRKVVDFPTPKAFQQMGEDIRKLSLEMPMAADGIAAIVAAAGQSGLAVDELLPFAEMAAKVGVAWEVSADQAGEALAKLKTALGFSVAETGLLADAINHLGNNTAASAPDILDVVRRVGAQASQFGLSAEQAAAFGAAMVGAGAQSEVAATSFRNMGRALTRGASATTRQSAAYRQLGLDSRKVAAGMQKDAVGTINDVLSRIRQVAPEMRAALITDLFGDEARALGPLITNSDLLAEALGLVADKTKYAGSAQEEYAVRAQTSANNVQLFKNRVTDLSISIGNALLPALNSLLGAAGPVISSISQLAQEFPNVTRALVGVTAAVTAFGIVSTAAQYGGLFLKGAFLDAAAGALTLTQRLGGLAIRPVTAAFRGLRAAIVGYTAAASIAGHGGALAAVGSSMTAALSPIRLVTGAVRALRYALLATGIGAALAAIAAAGTLIYNNWDGIKVALEAFRGAFMRAIEPVMPAIQPVIDGISSLVTWIGNLLGPIDETNGSWAAWGVAAGGAVGNVVAAIIGLPGKIVALTGELFEAGKALGESIYDGVVSLVSQLADYIKNQLSSALSWVGNKASGLLNTLTFGYAGSSSVDGARADGGPVSAGKTYLVGERGPELFSPGRSGVISPNEVFAGSSSGGREASSRTAGDMVQHNTFNIHGATMDLKTLVRAVRDDIDSASRNMLESYYGGSAYA